MSIGNISEQNFPVVRLVLAMRYIPKNTNVNIKGRSLHSCLLIEEGTYEYSFSGGGFTCTKGDVVYIPKGSVHRYKVMGENIRCTQVEFDISGDIFWSKSPVVLKNKAEAQRIVSDIVDLYNGKVSTDYFKAMSQLYNFCALLTEEIAYKPTGKSSIEPAIDYIENHYTEKIAVAKLAELCFMSESQLRRKFASEYRMSPITYKNRYITNKARNMLLHDEMSIGEVAEILGFDNVYAFSAMFKKYTDSTPSCFKKISGAKFEEKF